MTVARGEVRAVNDAPTEAATPSQLIKPHEISALTGLRFIAAFSILFMHTIEWSSPFSDTRVFALIGHAFGLIGMPLFFVLSGFVIHYNYGQDFLSLSYGSALRNFFSARFARIYPLFLFFAIFGIISDYMANWITSYLSDLISFFVHSLTLTQSWIYQIVVNDRLLLANGFGLSWSISDEFFFYLFYALLVLLIAPLKKPTVALLVIAAFSGIVILTLLLAYYHIGTLMSFAQEHVAAFRSRGENPENSFYRWFFYYSPYVRIWEFILGCLAAQLFQTLRERRMTRGESRLGAAALWGALVVLVLYAARELFEIQGGGEHIVRFFSSNFGCALPLAAIIFCTARYASIVARLLSHAWIIWLGNISYSIYAVHTWTVRPFVRPAANFNIALGVDAIFRIAFALAFTVIVASATYRLIEVPCRRYLRRKLMRPGRHTRASVAAAEAGMAS